MAEGSYGAIMLKYSAPSNIAIIKYMGKTSTQQNLPTNPSISFTLDHLRSYVTLEPIEQGPDRWEPLIGDGLLPIELSDKGKAKFLGHLKRIKDHWGVSTDFIVRSANNFPSDCGIASSSSSFAALTLAAMSECVKLKPGSATPDSALMSRWSRLGSGSSCRSFFGPWAIWQSEGAEVWDCKFKKLDHTVMLLDSSVKNVSSSEAHVRVTTSPKFLSRLVNVKLRLAELELANSQLNWNRFCDLAFEEFQEMHDLFETSEPSFSYRNPQTLEVLEQLEDWNKKLKMKILITMDAGNNIHCLSLPEHRTDLENLNRLFPKMSFLNSWDKALTKRGLENV